ncbi:MAG: hypothetical protein J7641_09255 [Cyanobacteria bacterium SID2]|nr:hypothetical protein [Cyanobacteria bacterium SID2]MBP0005845.1 hypothetical protein [Cyanobacteria bacterium SBC]
MANSDNATPDTNDITPQDVADTIEELQQYRERLLNETLNTAQRAKMKKSAVLKKLEPELERIDAILEQLRNRQAELTQNN